MQDFKTCLRTKISRTSHYLYFLQIVGIVYKSKPVILSNDTFSFNNHLRGNRDYSIMSKVKSSTGASSVGIALLKRYYII